MLRRGDGPAIVVFAPNHELAVQIREEIAEFERNSQFKNNFLYGGASNSHQVRVSERGV